MKVELSIYRKSYLIAFVYDKDLSNYIRIKNKRLELLQHFLSARFYSFENFFLSHDGLEQKEYFQIA